MSKNDDELVAIREKHYLLASAKAELVAVCPIISNTGTNVAIAGFEQLAQQIQIATRSLLDARDQVFELIHKVSNELDDAMGVK